MLALRPSCENCNKSLPPDSKDAMICTFECTFCITYVNDILLKVCPNCGGDFTKRPIRPEEQLKNIQFLKLWFTSPLILKHT